MDIFKCIECGTIVEELKTDGCHPSCCGKPMTKMEPCTTDGAHEKHVPVVTIDGNKVTVEVGSVAHPMLEAHYIEWIAIETEAGTIKGVQKKLLVPGMEPRAEFILAEGEKVTATYEYCNIHGLWKA